MMNADEVVSSLAIISVVVILGVVGLFIVTEARTQSACVANGWASGVVTWNLSRYCVTRINQSDVVKPLDRAEPR